MKFNLITLFIILCLGFTSCSENETPEPRTTRTILVYMMANNSLNSFASKNIESMIEGATSKNLNGGNLIVYYAPAGSPPELLRIKEENGVVKKIHLKDYEKWFHNIRQTVTGWCYGAMGQPGFLPTTRIS